MAEDWRLTVKLSDPEHAQHVVDALREHSVDVDLRARFGDRVAVSADDSNVFLYADTEDTARAAESVVQDVLRTRGIEAEFALDRWHALEERWEDANVPLPQTDADKRAEHDRLEREEAAESNATGVAEWEVRVELSSHADERELAQRLESEGWSVVSRWKYLIAGTANQDDALALAKQLEESGPAGAKVHVEPGSGLAWEGAPSNPFAIFGGLAG